MLANGVDPRGIVIITIMDITTNLDLAAFGWAVDVAPSDLVDHFMENTRGHSVLDVGVASLGAAT
jgi:hypothetical protein